MDALDYTYDGRSWIHSSTVADKNSFFHSAFGVRTDETEPYFDKHAKFRRMRWSTFLTYFEDETMPLCLTDILKECLRASNKYKDASVEDKTQFACYIYDIMYGDQGVNIEELPILSTLENIKIVILSENSSLPIIVKPRIEVLGSFLHIPEKPKEVVLSLEGNIFSRLNQADEISIKKSGKSDNSPVDKKRFKGNVQKLNDSSIGYEKSGSAGSKGVEFQVGLLTVFLLNAYGTHLGGWRLSTENKRAGKFDDVVLEWSQGDILLQAKHKETKVKITLEDLMSVNPKSDEFSLPKYFLSYQEIKNRFKIKNVVFCTNASFHGKTLKFLDSERVLPQSLLEYEGEDCAFYTFKEDILPYLKKNVKTYLEKNPKNKTIDETVITDENLEDFLKHLQFYSDFPAGDDLEKIIEQLLSRMNLHRQTSFTDVYAKVKTWFQQKNGVYLTVSHAQAIFLEIWRDKYWQMLEQYKVCFQHNDLHFQQSDRIIHIATDDGYFLQELKLYRALKNKAKTLYVRCDDGIHVQRQVLESFRLPKYISLIVVWPKFAEESVTEICGELKEILSRYEYKKVTVVAKCNGTVVSRIHGNSSVINSSVVFSDFSKDTQDRLLKRKNITFQGRAVSLKELFVNQIIEDYGVAVNSELLEKIVRDERIQVGVPLLGLDDHTIRFYINRQFKRKVGENEKKKWEIKTTKDTFPEEDIFEINEKLILISDIAGMGKSTVLTNLATVIKKRHPNLWVIRIQLNDYTTILKTSLENNTKTMSVMELLNSKPATKFTNQLEEFVFTLNGKVVLMLDGIDEISPDYTGLVLNMLIDCQKAANFAKIFTTTRPHMTKELEIKLGVKPFMLQPFSEKNQVEFLSSYWMYNLELKESEKERCEQYARGLISKMFVWMKVYHQVENNFPGVPLQARMLAEIFQKQGSNRWTETTDWEGCEEYLSTDETEPKLPEGMNIMKLYGMFIEKKRKVFIDKGNPSGNITANQALVDQFNESLSDHRSLALEVILDTAKCGFFSNYRKGGEDSERNLVKIGIVQKANNELHFIHRTFAEYFVADSLLRELRNEDVEFQKFLIDEVLLNPEYNMICAFFDRFLQKVVDSLPSDIFQRYQSLKNDVRFEEIYKSNLIYRLAEQGCVAILQLIFKCIDFKIIRDQEIAVTDLFETDFDENLLDIREHIFGNTLNMLRYLVSQGGVNIKNREGQTPLHVASLRGHLEMVKFLINRGANLESRDYDGRTPLHAAVYYSQFDVTKFLVEQGANVKSKDKNGRTIPYESIIGSHVNIASFLLENILEKDGLDVKNSTIPYMAAYLGRLDVVQLLVENGLDVNILLEDETLTSVAAQGGQLDTIKYLIGRGADINIKDSDGNTALHLAALEGQLDIVKFLIVECGIDVNVRNHFVGTALNLAVLSGHLDTVRFLVKHGVNIYIRDNYDGTVLHLASLMGRWDIVRFLVLEVGFDINVTNKNGCTPLHLAASRSQFDTVKFFVEQGADINARDDHGRTALHSIVRTGRLDTVMALVVEYEADVNITDNDGRTALHLAAKQGDLHISEFLVRCGADVEVKDNRDLTAVQLAASWGKLDVVKLLVKLGVDVDVRDSSGRTLLHRAARWNRLETVKYLVECGMDINVVDDDNRTALHVAAEKGKLDTVRYLVENGVGVQLEDDSGCSALHLAASGGHLNVARFLVEHGADIHIMNNFGRTALHLAALEDHLNMVEFLVDRNADVNAWDNEGHTALHLANSRFNFQIVVFLAETGAEDVGFLDF